MANEPERHEYSLVSIFNNTFNKLFQKLQIFLIGFDDSVSPNVARLIRSDQVGNLGIGSTFNDIRYDPDDGTPNYVGLHNTKGASVSDTEWIIYKFIYSGSATTQIQRVKGVWDNRASLF